MKKRLLNCVRVFDSSLLSLLFWELVGLACFLVVYKAAFVFGDEENLIKSICRGVPRVLSYDPTMGRCYPLTHWDCNFILFLPKWFHTYIPQVLYGCNALTLVLMMFCFVRFLRLDDIGDGVRSEVVDLAGCLMLLVAPCLLRMFWWNIFGEARMLVLESMALLFFVKGIRSDRSAWFVGSALALALLIGYKETSFVLIGVFAGSIGLFGWRQISRRCRAFVVSCVGIALADILFYLLVVRGQVTNSYADGRQVDAIAAFVRLFASPLPALALGLGLVRGALALRFRPNRHLMYDAMLFAGLCFCLAYVALGLVEPYYLTPAYAFFVPVFVHWVKWAAHVNKTVFVSACPLGGLLCVWLGGQMLSDYSCQLERRRSEMKELSELARNGTVERIYYYLPQNGLLADYLCRNFKIYHEYVGGDNSKMVCIREPREIKAHEVLVQSCCSSGDPVVSAMIRNATHTSRMLWFDIVYGPVSDGVRRTADGRGLVIGADPRCFRGCDAVEP